MTGRILCVLLLVLGSPAVGLPVGPVEAAVAEPTEPLAGVLDPALPRGVAPRLPEPGPAAGKAGPVGVRPRPPRPAVSLSDPVPRHVRFCVWRE
jgi:hypothetical protein